MADGFIAYQGPANTSPKYFASIDYQIPQFGNPADFFMKVLSCNYPKTDEDVSRLDKLRLSY